jgi:hypothetical protein
MEQPYEIRLFNGDGHLILVVPTMAVARDAALVRAVSALSEHGAARFEVRRLLTDAD